MSYKLTDGKYLSVALPFMISTMTQPLLGAVNTAVMGYLSDPAYISGVALGVLLLNTIYWSLGFLRVGTTGYAAQALGSGLAEERWTSFGRPLLVALVASGLILLLQAPILIGYLKLMGPDTGVADITIRYYKILIWGLPLTLFNYVTLGWLMGQARIRASIFLQISTNLLNIGLSLLLVVYFKYTVEGVAIANLIAQIYSAGLSMWFIWGYGRFASSEISWAALIKFRPLVSMLTSNANLMLRTVCLLVVNNLFMASSASLGTVVMAANAVLLQIAGIMSFLMDGMSNGNSLFSGQAVGSKNRGLFEDTIGLTFKWLVVLIVLILAGYGIGRDLVLSLFSRSPEVLAYAGEYSIYLFIYPLVTGVGVVFYGLFSGAACTGPIRDLMFLAMIGFIISRHILIPSFGNHGLWVSYLIFYTAQSILIWGFMPRLRRTTGFIKLPND